ncbi:uncharacterized protein SPPG_06655 [Spizellomyces punctatus DAOM BR117]|uniref:Proteasome activator Blm10 mid region domain-containing protein n=1 Tax=Spizellomyces punctatus (strain DAOM BR117) TaxID=645134 RepID=A0A0L0HBE3_SPIPD|nr:uncharacterized protein SPPG_06655 [Spizellomyces punctatus DAOM BR117]KNC98256.1 hypothetical protein SPPG_06655 [Spizellomyces punctatus DAOM BR117]|eukprot:XP_016606296.1 hypothetical protein SPPG_06655 [Spizellomyces punctatus DAOM BR117]
MLTIFLPVDTPPPLMAGLPTDPAPPVFYWVPTIFNLWSLLRPSSGDASLFIDILGRLAEAQIHCPSNVGWTQDQIRQVFSAGLGNLNLPVGSGTNGLSTGNMGSPGVASLGALLMTGSGDIFGQKGGVDPFAAFIVWTMFPENGPEGDGNVPPPPQTKSMQHLAEMIQAIESYFHPSNYGRWSFMLTRLLQMLAYQFMKRLKQESEPDCKTPVAYRITPAMRKEFVVLLRPVAYLSMFGKDPLSVNSTHSALKYLAWIHPESILPGLLDRIYPALETLTENHRTISCLGALYNVVLPLFNRKHYPQGGRHLPALLDLAIPGIDVNDPTKTSVTLLFIRHAIACTPLIDLTKRNRGPGGQTQPADRPVNMIEVDMGADLAETSGMDVDVDEEDEMCRMGTAVFEDWIGRFFERVFVMFENLPQQHGNVKSKGSLESSLILIVQFTGELLFTQMSPDIESIALRKVSNFVSENVIPNATKAIGMFCSVTGAPATRLATFVPLCRDRILTELEHGAGSQPSSAYSSSGHPFGFAAMSDASLHWYQCILYSVLIKSGKDMLQHKDTLLEIARETLARTRARRGYKWAGKLVRFMMLNASTIYPLEARSHGKHAWNDPDFINNSHKYWGMPGDPRNLDIDWHVPDEEELAFVVELVTEFVPLALEKMTTLIREAEAAGHHRDQREFSSEFQRWLSLLRNCLRGMTCLVPPASCEGRIVDAMDVDGDAPAVEAYEEDDARQRKRPLAAAYCFSNPDDPRYSTVQRLRDDIGRFMRDASVFFRTHQEDDTESVKQLLRCIQIYLTDRGTNRNAYENLVRLYKYMKITIAGSKDLARGHLPRYTLITRACTIHVARLHYNASQQTRSEISDAAVEEIVYWCFGRYAVVRKEAQRVLSPVVRCFGGGLKKRVFWEAVKMVESAGKWELMNAFLSQKLEKHVRNGGEGEEDADRMKGALYVLKSSAMLDLSLRNYEFLRGMLLALTRTHVADKPSIQKRWTLISKEILTQFQDIAIGTDVSVNAQSAAKKLVGRESVAADVEKRKKQASNRSHRDREEYKSMISELVDILRTESLPVSYRTMTVTFLELTLREDEPIPVEVTRLALTGVNSEELTIRKISLKLLSKILVIIKRRAKEVGKTPSNEFRKRVKAGPGGVSPADTQEFLRKSVETVQGDDAWTATEFQDSSNVGWYCWPAKYKIVKGASSRTSDTVPYNDLDSPETMQLLLSELASSEFWRAFFRYRSEEATSRINPSEAARGIAPAERFNPHAAMFYQCAFTILEDRPVASVQPILEDLIKESGDKAKQRAVAEAIGGIVRGAKYWDWNKQEKLWQWVGKVIASGLAVANPESYLLWSTSIRFICTGRDPRRVRPLLDIIFSQTFDPASQSFFTESKKLSNIRTLFSIFNWRLTPVIDPLLDTYLSAIHHPYEQVRQNLGASINSMLQIKWYVGARSVEDVVARVIDGSAAVPTKVDDEGQALMERVVGELRKLRAEENAQEDAVDYKNAGMTVMSWLSDAIMTSRVAGLYPYLPYLVPELLQMQVHADQDLQASAKAVAQMYANTPHPQEMVPNTVEMLLKAGTEGTVTGRDSPSESATKRWQVRWRVLPTLQVFYFRHLFLLDGDVVRRVVESVSRLLEDAQVEVRQLASVTLSGLIRCSQREAVLELKTRFEGQLSASSLPRRRRGQEPPTLTSGQQQQQQLLLAKRHAAVLGLSALVQAFPYEVPKWMPDVLVLLARSVGDPAPVGVSVQKLFSDFRRTHQDNWHEDMLAFTEEQRGVLSDLLISPSYYA